MNAELPAFLAGLETKRQFSWAFGERELPTGVPSRFLDLFPDGVVQKHDSFGIVYVRLWLVGLNPTRLMIGIFLGAERAQQSEPRRAATYIRNRLESLIDPLERERGFAYQVWGNPDIWWADDAPGSVRAVTRQLEQFITFKVTDPDENNVDEIEADIGELVMAVDAAIDRLQPIREFGKNILLLYYGENLPPAPVGDGFGEMAVVDGNTASAHEEHPKPEEMEVTPEPDWFTSLPAIPNLGDLRGMQDAYEKVVAALAAGKHVLLMGAPGVGKTELAEAVCRQIPQPYDVVTATSDWTSVHTIGGYMPVPIAGSDAEPLDFIPGVFTEAMAANKWLVIDEMNRADIDKAFGEMFTLLGGKRKSIMLPYRKRQSDGSYRRVVLGMANTQEAESHVYALDPSWRLIGTINTFDKASLFQMSFAFSRRVAVIEIAIPNESDYRAIIETAAAVLDNDQDNTFHDAIVGLLVAIFAIEGGAGLGALGLRVGPAIPLDIIRFIDRMRRFEDDPATLVLTALESYLFPQFEGRHEQTADIAAGLAAALGLQALPSDSMARLRTFTGAME
ncbi:AAA family ATPase [Sphingomonas aracearum]|uniref:AAA family ATPase n=1 Tax=Sphingomonas aracearum TaxID=2283317 RepID=UPI0011C0672E|nr:AAA family ATPase [Sphingomonas aracearum]